MRLFKRLVTIFFCSGFLLFDLIAQNQEDNHQISFPNGFISVDGTQLDFVVEGKGLPCLVIGSSVYYPKTFSKEIRDQMQLYFVDMRWFAQKYASVDLSEFSIQTIADDIEKVRAQLGLEDFILMGHSIHGTIALEYCKRYPDKVSHLVLIGSPNVFANERHTNAANTLWNAASTERKELQTQKWNAIKRKLEQLPPHQAFIQNYLANSPRYWHDPNYDASWLWEGMSVNMEMTNHLFGTLFNDYDMFEEDFSISIPTLVVLGIDDYVVPYTLWRSEYEQLSNLTVELFEKSGHTPQLEESEAFNRQLLGWIKMN